MSRRKFLAACVAGGAGTLSWMRFVEPQWFSLAEHDVKLGKGDGEPVRLLHISDLHASPAVSLPLIESGVSLGAEQKPDVVCLTGDFITWKYSAWEEYASILRKLSDHAPAFAVLGNHDGGRWARHKGYADTAHVRSMLEQAGITLLHNASQVIEVRGRRLRIVGLGDWWAREMDPRPAFAGRRDGSPTILLSHNPDTKTKLGDFPWDLMLCGHTHGGQCRIPLIGTPFAPVRDHRYVHGLLPWHERWIHITAGIGNLHGMRFNCRPEVSLLRIT